MIPMASFPEKEIPKPLICAQPLDLQRYFREEAALASEATNITLTDGETEAAEMLVAETREQQQVMLLLADSQEKALLGSLGLYWPALEQGEERSNL